MNLRANLLLGAWAPLVVLVVMLGYGCETHESSTVPSESLRSDRGGPEPRIDEAALSGVGFEELWYTRADNRKDTVNLSHLADEGLFVATLPTSGRPGRLKMVNRADGHPIWNFDLEGPLENAPHVYKYATLAPGKYHEVFFSVGDLVHCLTAEFGEPLWKRSAPFSVGTAIVADETGYVAGADSGRVYGVSKEASIDKWTFVTNAYVESTPVRHQTSTYVTSTDGSAYRFSTAAGYRQGFSWSFKTGAAIYASPVAFSQWVFVASTDYKLYCLGANDGTRVWSFLGEAPIYETPVVYSYEAGKEFVFVIAYDRGRKQRKLFCVNLRKGDEVWQMEGISRVVSLGRKNLYVLTDQETTGERSLLALDAWTGKEQFRLPIDPGFRFIPTNTADFGRNRSQRGRIFLISGGGAIQAIAEK